MKKTFSLFLAAILVTLALSGCSSKITEPSYADGVVANDYFSVNIPSGFTDKGADAGVERSGNQFATMCFTDDASGEIVVTYHTTAVSRPQVTGSREYFEAMFRQYAGYVSAELIDYDSHATESIPYVKFAVRAVAEDGSIAYHYFIYVHCKKDDVTLNFFGPNATEDAIPEILKTAYDSFAVKTEKK